MNISYSWLKEYVDFSLSPTEVADALTSIGLEVDGVEEVQAIRGGLKGLVVGHVLTCAPHPDSDHMHVCRVDVGTGDAQQIVCGAPNVAAGQKVIVATLGTVLYDGDKEFTIKKSKLRGVESNGMICAEDEIGVGTSHDGIILLPEDTPVGLSAAEYYNLQSDYVIEVDITPNRADACSHYGVARDLYAWLVQNGHTTALHRPTIDEFQVDDSTTDIDIVVENTEACPRYAAITVSDCQVGESPEWLRRKLETVGCRSINNVVDVTNYIMFAYGQPLHCFDVDMIEGGRVVVGTQPEGTKFVTLDGVEHTLSSADLTISNANAPMCIAGVFGGKGSGTYDTTHHVLLESAYFNPTWIRKSARRHGLSTDASFRFERGIDPDGQIYALKRAAMLIKELCGGRISMNICDIEAPTLKKHFDVELDYQYMHDLVGKVIPEDDVKRITTALEMTIVSERPDGLTLRVPAYRVDVQHPCDVVEDILRIYGYNNVEIPTAVKSSLTIKGDVDRSSKLLDVVAEQLVGQGFNEILNNSLTRAAYYDVLGDTSSTLVNVMNPLSSDLGVLRGSLLFGGLEVILHNVNRKNANLRLFEYGKCYHYDKSKAKSQEEKVTSKDTLAPYSEENHLGLWLTGKRIEGAWAHPDEDSSIYELKAYVWGILQRLGVDLRAYVLTESCDVDVFSKALTVADRNGVVLLRLGLVKKALMQLGADTLTQPVYYADIAWDTLMRKTRKQSVSFSEISKFPAVSRDLALLIDADVPFASIEQVARATEKKLLRRVTLFDVYEGKNIASGKKSYAVNFLLQDETKTMNDKQTDAIMQKIIANLQKQLGAQLR